MTVAQCTFATGTSESVVGMVNRSRLSLIRRQVAEGLMLWWLHRLGADGTKPNRPLSGGIGRHGHR